MTEQEIAKKKREEQQKSLGQAYAKVIRTDAGKKMMADLEIFCNKDNSCVYEQAPDAMKTMFELGKRRVLLRIESMIKKGNENG